MADKEKAKSVGIATYARVRRMFTDRESNVRIVETKTAAESSGGKGSLTVKSSAKDTTKPLRTQFTDVFGEEESNEDTFSRVCQPLIDRCLEGYKVLLVAYGQTGSGKTFTLIGAKGPGQLGLLPRTIQALLEDERVLRLEMKGFEAYATSLTRIPLYDLISETNRFTFRHFVPPGDNPKKNKEAEYRWSQEKSTTAKATWKSKKGSTSANTMTQGETYLIKSVEDGLNAVELAHDASHFARTGKNPESSRGHTVYILKLQIENPEGDDYDPVTTEFVVVDLAGSEGGSTLDALPDGPDKTARFLEGGVINYGLTQLKDMFKEIRKKGKLKPSQGNGLRKLLYPFVTSNTMMSIVFTLSPSIDNVAQTRATMKFAQDACKLKMKPVKDKGKANYQKMYEKLKERMEEKLSIIVELERKISEGIENSQEMRLEHEELRGKLNAIYAANPDLNYSQFAKHELDSHLDEMVARPVKVRMEQKISQYREMIKKVAEESDEEINVDEFVEDTLENGVPLENAYESLCKKIKVEPSSPLKLDDDSGNASPREHLMMKRVSLSMSSQKSENWILEAEDMQMKSRAHRAESVRFMDGLERLIDPDEAGILSDDSQSEEEFDSEGDLSKQNLDELFPKEADDEDEDIPSAPRESPPIQGEEERSEIPAWFYNLSQEEKLKIETFFGSNLEKGQLTADGSIKLMQDWNLTDKQMDELHRYLVFKRSQDVDVETIQEFQSEMNLKPGVLRMTSAADGGMGGGQDPDLMQKILELRHRIHVLENEKRAADTLTEYTEQTAKRLISSVSTARGLAESKANLFQSKINLFADELASEKQLNEIQKLEKHELRQELEYHLEIIQAKDQEIAQISLTATSLMSQLKKSNFALEKSKALQRQLLLGRLEIMQQNNRQLERMVDGGGARQYRQYR